MSQTPMIDLLEQVVAYGESVGRFTDPRSVSTGRYRADDRYLDLVRLAAEVRALQEETSSLRGQMVVDLDRIRQLTDDLGRYMMVANATPTSTVRKLREYKGVTYDNGRWLREYSSCSSASSMCHYWDDLTDDDHAPLLALKADPFVPLPDVRALVKDVLTAATITLADAMEHEEANVIDAAVVAIIALVRGERAS
jgi:hypothetical protein